MNYLNIHKNAKIGNNVTIQPFTTIEDDVKIGDNTWVGSNVTIFSGSRIGESCKIYPGAVIGGKPQDLKFKDHKTYTIIGNHTTIREYVTVNSGTQETGKTVVGDHCLLMAYSHVGHDAILKNNCILANCVHIGGHSELEEYVTIQAVAGTQQFVKVGAYAFIGSGSIIRKDVPPFIKAAREPLAFMGVNVIGLRRLDFTSKTIQIIQEVYRLLYFKNQGIKKVIAISEEEIEDIPERNQIIDFICESKNGIIRRAMKNGVKNGV